MTIELAPHFDPPFVPVLQLRELPAPLWKLQGRLRFYSCVVNDWVEALEGFISDGCSIPLAALLLLAPFGITRGLAAMAGYIHDALYTSQKYDRETCDRILREMVIAMGYPEALAEEFYVGVRIGGGSHWNLPNVPQPPHVAAAMNLSPADTIQAAA
jgi:hypothetical protein